MCYICDGATDQDHLRWMHIEILGRGWTTVGVEARVPWAYTVGLTEHMHPELVVAGTKLPSAYELLDRLARRVIVGERFSPAMMIDEERGPYSVVTIHPSRLAAGLCAAVSAYGREMRCDWGRVQALQVQVPDEWFCKCHRGSQPRLDLPGRTPGPPNREARRRRRRTRPRR